MKVQLLSHTQNPELLIATAAKLCYSPSNIKAAEEHFRIDSGRWYWKAGSKGRNKVVA